MKKIEAKQNIFSLEAIKLEFEYAKQTSIQAQADRLTLVNFYIGVFAAITTLFAGFSQESNWFASFSILFFVLSCMGLFFVVVLVRLRQAWISSVYSMNKLKLYFFEADADLKKYFSWTMDTLPKPNKFKTLHYLSSLFVLFLGSVALYVFCTLVSLNIVLTIFFVILYILFGIFIYEYMLQRDV